MMPMASARCAASRRGRPNSTHTWAAVSSEHTGQTERTALPGQEAGDARVPSALENANTNPRFLYAHKLSILVSTPQRGEQNPENEKEKQTLHSSPESMRAAGLGRVHGISTHPAGSSSVRGGRGSPAGRRPKELPGARPQPHTPTPVPTGQTKGQAQPPREGCQAGGEQTRLGTLLSCREIGRSKPSMTP